MRLVDGSDEGVRRLNALLAAKGEGAWEEAWEKTDWSKVDLANIPTPMELSRDDGALLLYGGRRWNVLHGQPDAAKTWILLLAVKQYLDRCEAGTETRPVVMLDYEDGPEAIKKNLMLLGASSESIDKWVIHYTVTETILKDGVLAPGLAESLNVAGFVSLDSALASAETEGLSPSEPAQVSEWRQKAMVPIAAACREDVTLLLIDHDPMGSAKGRRQAYGGQAKFRAIKGVSIRAFTMKQPVKGREGRIALFITKDTLSQVSEVSQPPKEGSDTGYRVGVFVMAPMPDDMIDAHIDAPAEVSAYESEDADQEAAVMDATRELNAKGMGISKSMAEDAIRAKALTIQTGKGGGILSRLADEGLLVVGKGRTGYPVWWIPDFAPKEGEE